MDIWETRDCRMEKRTRCNQSLFSILFQIMPSFFHFHFTISDQDENLFSITLTLRIAVCVQQTWFLCGCVTHASGPLHVFKIKTGSYVSAYVLSFLDAGEYHMEDTRLWSHWPCLINEQVLVCLNRLMLFMSS